MIYFSWYNTDILNKKNIYNTDIFRTWMHFLRVKVTFYDAVNIIYDVIGTANPFPSSAKFTFFGVRNNKTRQIRRWKINILSLNKKYPFYNSLYLFYYRVNTNLANVRFTHNSRFMCTPNFTRSKLGLPAKISINSFCMCALCGIYPYLVSVSDFTDFFFKNHHNSIKLYWNKSKKMQR